MRLSNYLLPALKQNPAEATIISHQLMLRAGMIRQLSSGIYSWLPLGLKILRNIEEIIRQEINQVGGVELLMPTMQPAKLWAESGRGDYGKETLTATDRHDNQLIYGPTSEEVITDIFRNNVHSYKQLPMVLYNIQWKFRDEIRPRFGVMRGREFLMKDAYSFNIDEESAKQTYDNMYRAYLRIFKRLGLKAIPFKADSGSIGGDMSHEFQVIAQTGESEIFYDPQFEELIEAEEPDIEQLKQLYSAADEMHDPSNAPENVQSARGIEVGHIFYLGDKYSAPLKAEIMDNNGRNVTVKMGCYGIGISRLVGAIIEANHDGKGIIWPESIVPFKVGIVNIKTGHEACDKACDELYNALTNHNIDVLYDDRKESAGSKLATQDLIGTSWIIAIGPRTIANNLVEIKNRLTGEKQEIYLQEAIAKFTNG